jgi:hypothetical protein
VLAIRAAANAVSVFAVAILIVRLAVLVLGAARVGAQHCDARLAVGAVNERGQHL